MASPVQPGAAIQLEQTDCFVALLLAMTREDNGPRTVSPARDLTVDRAPAAIDLLLDHPFPELNP